MGALKFVSTNVFYKQVRNLVFDTTDIPGLMLAVHWPSSQVTSIQNWGWTYKSLTILDCDIGINMSDPSVGSATLLDSGFFKVKTAIITATTRQTVRAAVRCSSRMWYTTKCRRFCKQQMTKCFF
jgi:hypothetical protein